MMSIPSALSWDRLDIKVTLASRLDKNASGVLPVAWSQAAGHWLQVWALGQAVVYWDSTAITWFVLKVTRSVTQVPDAAPSAKDNIVGLGKQVCPTWWFCVCSQTNEAAVGKFRTCVWGQDHNIGGSENRHFLDLFSIIRNLQFFAYAWWSFSFALNPQRFSMIFLPMQTLCVATYAVIQCHSPLPRIMKAQFASRLVEKDVVPAVVMRQWSDCLVMASGLQSKMC